MTKDLNPDKNKTQLRMGAEHVFQFDCHPGVSCFTKCCRDVTIVLTPYDVLRLKNSLDMPSDEFIDKYTIVIPKGNLLIPMVVLRMNEDDKRCSIVSNKGCMAYDDRPWACRMYPLDVNDDGTFKMITDTNRCKGLIENETKRIGDWLIEQGVAIYEEMNGLFSQITSPLQAQELDIDNPQIFKMVFMALYNLDKFRDFVLNSSFMERFEIDPIMVEKINRNDTELLKFSFDWVKFGIFGQKTLQVKEEEAKRAAARTLNNE
ncbi:YkgJ family cysteine cluster protein [Thermodesulfobacteriota bacterium]